MELSAEFLQEQLVYELTSAPKQRGFYICPLCGSGTGPKGTAAFSMRDKVHGHCFACGFDGDIFDLELLKSGINPSIASKDQKAEAFRKVKERYSGMTLPEAYVIRKAMENFKGSPPFTGSEKPAAPAADPAPAADFSEYLHACADKLAGSPGERYLYGRGFTQETMRRFMLGYDPVKNEITIPHNKECSYYSTRRLAPDAEPKHWKPKDVPAILYNADALYQSKPCFVVESPLCAVSVMQEGGSAVGLAGIGGKNLFLRMLKNKRPSAFLILCLDNDDPGQAAQKDLAEQLAEMKIPYTTHNIAVGCKDPNELLQKDQTALRGGIAAGIELAEAAAAEAAEQDREEREKRTGPGMIDSFLQDVQTRMYEPLPTGIRDIDAALDGGFMRQQLVCLGAAPGAGKTALAQWIFEGMAAKGVSCIFLNLEMSRNQILARSLARCAARKGLSISSVKLLRGYDWTDEQRKVITEAAEEYKRTVAPQMIYNPDGLSANLDDILSYLEVETLKAEAAGKAAPCVVLDYLQIIRGKDHEDGAEIIKRAVQGLKDFAIRHNTVVFLIIAHNRDSNKSGTVTMESGRDTSAIEYSGDTQIGLTFTRCLKGWKDEKGAKHEKGKAPDELTQEERKEITLKIVKSRFGGVGRRVDLRFDGETMTYTQLFKDFEPVDVDTPFDYEPRQTKMPVL